MGEGLTNILTQKCSIIIIDNSLDNTGALKAILASAVALSHSYEFVFVLPQKTRIVQLVRDHEFKVATMPFVELSKRPRDVFFYLPYLLKNGFALSRLIASHNARIVHVNDYYNLVGVVAKMFVPSVRVVTHVRKLPDSFPLLLSRFWLGIHERISDQVICVSKAVKRQLGNNYSAVLIYDGMQDKEKHQPQGQGSLNLDRPEIRLLYLGHFIPGKGQDFALEAFRQAYRECKALRLRFVGGDMGLRKNREFRESLQRKVREWSIGDAVEFDGFAHDVEKEIKEADIVLSFSESESFSFTCLEALYYGTPLIASDSGGPSELFEHKRSGYLVRNRDVDAMAEAIIFLAQSRGERQKYSTESRKFVRENFSESKSCQGLRSVYEAAIASSESCSRENK